MRAIPSVTRSITFDIRLTALTLRPLRLAALIEELCRPLPKRDPTFVTFGLSNEPLRFL